MNNVIDDKIINTLNSFDGDMDEDVLYDNCVDFMNGEYPTNDQINMLRVYLLDCIHGMKDRFKSNLRFYLIGLKSFMNQYNKNYTETINNYYDFIDDLHNIKDNIKFYKDSKLLTKYILESDDNVEIVNDVFENEIFIESNDSLKHISFINTPVYTTDIDTLISYKYIYDFFMYISKYNDICIELANRVKSIYIDERS